MKRLAAIFAMAMMLVFTGVSAPEAQAQGRGGFDRDGRFGGRRDFDRDFRGRGGFDPRFRSRGFGFNPFFAPQQFVVVQTPFGPRFVPVNSFGSRGFGIQSGRTSIFLGF